MDKTSNAQYSSNLFSRVGYGYKLTYTEATNRLTLMDKNGSMVFDISLEDIAQIKRSARIFLFIKLKDNTNHYISFGNVVDSANSVSQESPNALSYRATMKSWLALFKSKGVKIKLPLSTKFFYAALFLVLLELIIIALNT